MLTIEVLGLVFLSLLVNSEVHFSIYKLECINENDTIYVKNISCFLKTISRGLNVLTSTGDLVQPLNYIKARFMVYEKSSANTYRSVIIDNTFEICSLWKEDKLPPLIQLILPLISKFAPKLIHPCPYQGRNVGIENLSIDIAMLPLIQDVNYFDAKGADIHWVKLYCVLQQKPYKRKHLGNRMKVSTISPTDASQPEG